MTDSLPPIVTHLLQCPGTIGGELPTAPRMGAHPRNGLILDPVTRTRLLMHDPGIAPLLRPLVRAADVAAWHHSLGEAYLIVLAQDAFASYTDLATAHPALARHLGSYPDWHLPASDTVLVTLQAGIAGLPATRTQPPRFAPLKQGAVPIAALVVLPDDNPILLALLQSRVLAVVQAYLPTRSLPDLIARLPVPAASEAHYNAIAQLATQIAAEAEARTLLRQQARNYILKNLGPPGTKLDDDLLHWWRLDFLGFVLAIGRALNNTIPERFQPEWEQWLAAQRSQHQQHTMRMQVWQQQLDQAVYTLYGLTDMQVTAIEDLTPNWQNVV